MHRPAIEDFLQSSCVLASVVAPSETLQKKCYSENATMTYLKKQNSRIQISDTKCYATSSQNRRKERSMTSKSASLRGKPPLHYTNEQFLDDSNEKTSFLYIRV